MPDLLPRRYLPQAKPTAAQIDWDHPLARGLVFCPIIGSPGNHDLVGGNPGALIGSGAQWAAATRLSPALVVSNNGSGAAWEVPVANRIGWNSFTLVFWLVASQFSGFAFLFGTNDGDIGITEDGTTGQWRLYRNNANVSSSPGAFFPDGTLHMYAATVDAANNVALYTDGALVGTGQASQIGAISATGYQILGAPPGQAVTMGVSPHAAVYDRALSAAEVRQLYAEPFCMLQRPSLAWETVAPPAGSTFTDLAAMQALLSGPTKALAAQQALLQKTQAASAGASARLVEVAADDSGTWPKLPAFSANNWFDHFTGSSLDGTTWGTIQSGGSVTVTDGYLDLNCATPGQAAAAYWLKKLDLTKHTTLTVCWSALNGTGPSDTIQLVSGAWAPGLATYAAYNPLQRMLYGIQNGPGTLGHTPSYFNASHVQTYWDGTNNVWTTTNSVSGATPCQTDDYYVTTLEIDGPNSRFRFAGYGLAFGTPGTWTFDQGWRMFVLTDWVPFSSLEDTSQGLWLVLGNAVTTNGKANDFRYEWVEYAEGPFIEAWAARKGTTAPAHDIGHYWSLNGTRFLPESRSGLALARGSTYDANECQEPCVVRDGAGTDWMFYMSADASETQSISLASAPTATPQNGPWTKYASNPILTAGASGNDSASIGTPSVIYDQTDATWPWKMLYNEKGADGKWRTAYATATTPTGPWTKQGTVIDVGPAGSNDELWARAQSINRYNNLWYVWYEGHDAAGCDHSLLATGPTLSSLTKTNVPTYYDNASGQDVALTADLTSAPGRTVNVSDATKLTPDGMVLFSQSNNGGTWSASRIRKVVTPAAPGAVELYHGLTGFAASYPTRMIQNSGSNTWNVRRCVKVGSEWWFYSVVWEPFSAAGDGANYGSIYEQCYLRTHSAAAPDGAAGTYQLRSDPVIPRGNWNDSISVENMSLLTTPYTATTTTATAGATALFQATKGDLAALAALLSRTGSDTAGAQALLVATRATQAGATGLLKGTFGASAGTAALLSGAGINITAGQQALLQGTFTDAAGATALFQKTSADSAQAQALFRKTAADVAGATALLKGTGSGAAATQAVLKGSFPTQAGLQAILRHTHNANSATEGLFSRTGSTQAGVTAIITGFTGAVAGSVVLLQAQRQAAVSLHALFQRTSSLAAGTEAIFTQVGSQQAGAFTILSKQRSATTWAQGLLQGTFAAQAGVLAVIGVTIRPARATLSDAPLFAVTVGDDLNV